MNSSRLKLFTLVAFGMFLFTSCGNSLGPYWVFGVENRTDPIKVQTYARNEVCLGGLKARVEFPESGIVKESPVLVVDQEYSSERFLHGSREGGSVILEAWCYDENNVEVGYIKFVSVTKSSPITETGSFFVAPPLEASAPDSSRMICIAPTEKRGEKLPCAVGFNFNRQ